MGTTLCDFFRSRGKLIDDGDPVRGIMDITSQHLTTSNFSLHSAIEYYSYRLMIYDTIIKNPNLCKTYSEKSMRLIINKWKSSKEKLKFISS